MADLGQLRELYAWMRETGVLYARCGELELRIEALPVPLAAPVDIPHDPAEAELHDLETLLFSSGAEAGPFLRAMRAGGKAA